MGKTKLAHTATAADELVRTRVLNAPRSLVFRMWTDPEQLAQWWGPHGFTAPVCELDVRPRGAILIHMRGPDGRVYKMTGSYREIAEPERLVFVSADLDVVGVPLFEVLTTVVLTEQGSKTKMRITAQVMHKTPAAEKYIEGMEEGWKQTLDRLEKHLARQAGIAKQAKQ